MISYLRETNDKSRAIDIHSVNSVPYLPFIFFLKIKKCQVKLVP